MSFDSKSNELIFHKWNSVNRVAIEKSIYVEHKTQIEVGKSFFSLFFDVESTSILRVL